jgi:hypothetical protein
MGFRGKGRSRGGFGKNFIFSPPPPFTVWNREDRRGRWPVLEGRAPAALATAAAGRWGKMERRPRGSHPCAHLGLKLLGEAAPRCGSGGGEG